MIKPITQIFLLPVEKKKWRKRNESRVNEKLTIFFTKKPHSKTNVTQKSCTFHDFPTTLSFRCCEVLPFNVFSRIFCLRIQFEPWATLLRNGTSTIASSIILQTCQNNVTWRNRPTELAGEQQLTRWMFNSMQQRLQDIFKSSTAKGDCGISSSESTFFLSTIETLSSSWAW